jgi:hypothetical protein
MIEGGGQDPGSARRVRLARRRRRSTLLAIVATALLVLAALFGRRLLEGRDEPAAMDEALPAAPTRPVEPRAAAPAEPDMPAAEQLPAEPLPALAESDAMVRERAAAASSRPELAAWLAGEGLVTRFVAAVDNVANGESPRSHLRELGPRAPFQTTSSSGSHFIAASSWSRYDAAVAVFASLDAEVCAQLHRLLLPLFEEAYGELGRREGRFDDVLARAFRELLRTPLREGEIEVVPGIRSYRFADPDLQALSPAQKQLLRMGPANTRAVQAKLRELAAALDLDVEGSTRPSPAT